MAYVEATFPLFDEASLDGIYVEGKLCPRITLIPLRPIGTVGGDDYFLLERYIVPKNDTELVNSARRAVSSQAIAAYMIDTDDGAVYMSSIYFMSEYDVGDQYTTLDISRWFHNRIQKIIDTTVNADDNYLIYRVIYSHQGNEYASMYMLGVEDVPFQEEVSSEARAAYAAIALPSATSGDGTLYRKTRDGRIVTKGTPLVSTSPRYQGPIESAKDNTRAQSMKQKISNLNAKMDEIETDIEESMATMNTVSNELTGVIRSF